MSEPPSNYYNLFDNRVRFAETDAQSVVFFGEYVTYMDEAALQYFREIDYDYERLLEGEWQLVVAHIDMDYHSSATFGDVLANAVRISDLGERSLTFAYEGRDRDDDTLRASGSIVMVAIDEDGNPTPLPNAFREAVERYQDEQFD